MTSVTIEQLGFMSEIQVQQKISSIQKLAAHGLHIYPCHPVTPYGCGCGKKHKDKKEWGKHPSNGASHLITTNDPVVAGNFWSLVPNCNVAANPKQSRKIVIDIDPRSGGHTSWAAIIDRLDETVPPTWTTLTGLYDMENDQQMRGTHLWFNMPYDYNFPPNLESIGFIGIDIKFNGGVLVPPSSHGSGVSYEWKEGFSPDDLSAADLPEELLTLILSAARRKVVRDVIGYRLPPANAQAFVESLLDCDLHDGSRNVTFYRIACQVAYWLGCHTDQQIEQVKKVLSDFNKTRVHPPLDDSDNYQEQINRAISFVQSGLTHEH